MLLDQDSGEQAQCGRKLTGLFELLPGSRQPNLNLTPEEKRVFFQLFQAADTTNLGVITGEVAVPFFEKTRLPPEHLGLVRCQLSRFFLGVEYPRYACIFVYVKLIAAGFGCIDLADRRQREQGSSDPFWLWSRVAIDWTCSGWSSTDRGIGGAA